MDGMIASTVVEGSMTRALFIEYLEFTVVSHKIQPLPKFTLMYTLLDASMHTVSWKSKCIGDGQCKDSSWGRDS